MPEDINQYLYFRAKYQESSVTNLFSILLNFDQIPSVPFRAYFRFQM